MEKNRLNIIYEDKNILVVDKKPGLLTISAGKNTTNNLYHEVYTYLHKKNQKVFIVHRLDKDTSGLVIFAKSEKIKNELQENWHLFKREYTAKIHGKLEGCGKLEYKLITDKIDKVYESPKGEYAVTEYEVIKSLNNSLVKINILTGKKHQIRYSFSKIGHPILGDKKYGLKDGHKRLYLHASKLKIKLLGKEYEFSSEPKF